jgi:hypothetical protein
MATEQEVLTFSAASLNSVWTLELLLFLKRQAPKCWQADALIRELRSSQVVVSEGLANLQNAGLVIEEPESGYRYQAASPHLDEMVSELAGLYASRPTAVIRAIVNAPNRKLKMLSDAFKLKE